MVILEEYKINECQKNRTSTLESATKKEDHISDGETRLKKIYV
jgi:hypothetical protein